MFQGQGLSQPQALNLDQTKSVRTTHYLRWLSSGQRDLREVGWEVGFLGRRGPEATTSLGLVV